MRIARWLVLAAAAIAAALTLASGLGARSGLWSWQEGFGLLRWSTYLGLGAAALSLVHLVLPRIRGPRPALVVVALLLGSAAAAPALVLRYQAGRLPYIHDVTTDTTDPPAFVALLAERREAPNGADYAGAALAAEQKRGYPDIGPLELAVPPSEAFARALRAARDMGWDIAASDAPSGRIEATATTAWFGFKDDVVVRVRPSGAGARVDVRSMSRVGKSDVGANARRIRQYLSRLS